MPFRYENSNDPRLTGTIADLMLRGPAARAAAAERIGEVQARGAQQEAGAWSGAVQNIGQLVSNIPAQLQQQKRAGLQDELTGLQLQDTKLRMSDNAAARADQERARHDALTTQIGLRLHDSGNTLEAMQEALNTAEKNGLIDTNQAQEMGAAVSADPSKIPLVSRGWIGATPQGRAILEKTITQKPGEVTTRTFDNAPVGMPLPEARKTQAELAADAADPKSPTQAQSATALDLMRPPKAEPAAKSYQHVDKLLDGKPTTLLLDPAPGGKLYDLNQKEIENAAARVKPIPPASVTVRNMIDASGKGEISSTAKGIAEYRIPAPSARSMASGEGKALMDQVLRANPDYDAGQFPARSKMRIQFTSGAQSQTINSINTAIGHLDQFVDVAKALDNGNFRPGNQAFNWLKATFGDSAPTNFEGIRSIMSGELASAFKKSGATDQEIKSVESAIASKNSTSQLVDYATKIAIPALGSKIAAFDQQYHAVMGKNDPFKVLTPDAEDVLTKYGFDPAHPRMGGPSTPTLAPSATHRVMQNGVTYDVTTDASGKVIKSEQVRQ